MGCLVLAIHSLGYWVGDGFRGSGFRGLRFRVQELSV